jgi:hypothetical protein
VLIINWTSIFNLHCNFNIYLNEKFFTCMKSITNLAQLANFKKIKRLCRRIQEFLCKSPTRAQHPLSVNDQPNEYSEKDKCNSSFPSSNFNFINPVVDTSAPDPYRPFSHLSNFNFINPVVDTSAPDPYRPFSHLSNFNFINPVMDTSDRNN